MSEPTKQLLVIGTGRCGTKYVSRLLQSAGLDVGHEKLGEDGIAAWRWAMPHVRKSHAFFRLVHVVREPLACIASLQTIQGGSWRWIIKHSPVQPSMSGTKRAMWHWWHWNLLCQAQASATVRLEDLPLLAEDVFGVSVAADTPTNINARRHGPVTWDDLRRESATLTDAIRALARQYGYEVDGWKI